jgi:putative ABC transport system permease protein
MIWNALWLGLGEIRRNLLRSFLTILGIVIGVAAVIIIVTLGSGATLQVQQQIGTLGSNMLIIRPGQRMGPGMSSVAPAFSRADAQAVAQEVAGVDTVAPTNSVPATAVFNNANWSTTVTGADNRFFVVRAWSLEAGRPFTDGEQRSGAAVCVIGATVQRQLFGGIDPLGRRLRLNKLSCDVIGVLVAKGQSTMGSDQDDVVVLPLRTLQRRIVGNLEIRLIQLSLKPDAETSQVRDDLERLLRERRHLSRIEENNFMVMDMKEIMATVTGTTRTLTTMLGTVGAVSLLVGGIGIMNIMLVSVTERTREIGIRLAIGAMERDVLMQFLIEAVALSVFGGMVGIVLALGSSYALAQVLEIPFVLRPDVIVLGALFSGLVGVVFGYYPARKAARLDPIEALRHE